MAPDPRPSPLLLPNPSACAPTPHTLPATRTTPLTAHHTPNRAPSQPCALAPQIQVNIMPTRAQSTLSRAREAPTPHKAHPTGTRSVQPTPHPAPSNHPDRSTQPNQMLLPLLDVGSLHEAMAPPHPLACTPSSHPPPPPSTPTPSSIHTTGQWRPVVAVRTTCHPALPGWEEGVTGHEGAEGTRGRRGQGGVQTRTPPPPQQPPTAVTPVRVAGQGRHNACPPALLRHGRGKTWRDERGGGGRREGHTGPSQ